MTLGAHTQERRRTTAGARTHTKSLPPGVQILVPALSGRRFMTGERDFRSFYDVTVLATRSYHGFPTTISLLIPVAAIVLAMFVGGFLGLRHVRRERNHQDRLRPRLRSKRRVRSYARHICMGLMVRAS